MKILYIGSICNNQIFETNNRESKLKVSSAPQHFESAILKGISSISDIDLSCISAECTATYPNGNRLLLNHRKDIIENGLEVEITSAINLPFLKPYTHALSVGKLVKEWLITYQNTNFKGSPQCR